MNIYKPPGKHTARKTACAMGVALCFVATACTQHPPAPAGDAPPPAQERIAQLHAQGEEAYQKEMFGEAIRLHTEELQLATDLNDTLAMIRAMNDLDTALDHYILSAELKDSNATKRTHAGAQNIRIGMERQQNEDRLREANELYLSERSARWATATVLGLIIVVAAVIIGTLWYTLRERSKTQLILQQMNKSREDFFANIAIDPADLSSAESVVSEQDRQFIGRFVDTVYSQMAKGRTDAESVAAQLGMSRSQLNRRIMAITGQNTLTYITQIRISKAKRLLRADISTPIGDVANKCGFDDVAYFSRIFKQQTNMTPSQYRKMI